MKQLLKNAIKKILKFVGYTNYVNRLYQLPGTAKLYGKVFTFHHKLAYVATLGEVIKKEIYKFKTNNNKPVIIDCGANMGLSILFFSMNYPEAEIIAFEPDISVLPCLEKNIETYQMHNVKLFKQAVWNSTEILDFYTDNGLGGRLDISYADKKPFKVEAIRLKDFISDKHIDFLKMDIEGAEYKVIKDCEPFLNQIENLFIEYHCPVNEIQRLDEILLIMKNNGFRYHLSEGFSRRRPFVDNNLTAEIFDLLINIYGYRKLI